MLSTVDARFTRLPSAHFKNFFNKHTQVSIFLVFFSLQKVKNTGIVNTRILLTSGLSQSFCFRWMEGGVATF